MDVIDPKIANVSCWTKKSIWMILRIFWPLQKKNVAGQYLVMGLSLYLEKKLN